MLIFEKFSYDWMYSIRKKIIVYRNVVGLFMDEMLIYYLVVVCFVYDYNIFRKVGIYIVLFLGFV